MNVPRTNGQKFGDALSKKLSEYQIPAHSHGDRSIPVAEAKLLKRALDELASQVDKYGAAYPGHSLHIYSDHFRELVNLTVPNVEAALRDWYKDAARSCFDATRGTGRY